MLIVSFLFYSYILCMKHLLLCSKSKFIFVKTIERRESFELLYFMSWLIFKHISFQVSFLWITSEGGKLCIFLCFPGDNENQPLLYNWKHKKQWRKLWWRSDSCSAVEINRPICCIISSAPKWFYSLMKTALSLNGKILEGPLTKKTVEEKLQKINVLCCGSVVFTVGFWSPLCVGRDSCAGWP